MAVTKSLSTFCAILLIQTCSSIQWYRTAQGTTDRLSSQPDLSFTNDFDLNVTVVINRTVTYQTILGFGGAFTDSASYVFSKLNSTHQSTILDMYFSEGGLRYNMARLPMGACDFSLEHYTYDDVENDANLTSFSIDHDRQEKIPFIKRAMDIISSWNGDPIHIVATPWSPPAWMKTSNSPYCPQSCSNCQLKDQYRQSWADYFVKFVTDYGNEGIGIWGVTVQNEPEYCPSDYESMNFTPETERDYVKGYLGPTLKKAHPDVNILIYDHNKDHVVDWVKTVYSDNDASSYVWGTAIHWYTGDEFENLHTAHSLFPEKPILATESTDSRELDPQNPLWSHGEHYAHDIMGDMNNWVVGFIDWNLLLDQYGGPNHKGPDECEGKIKCGFDSMILVDIDQQIIYPQIFYYYVGHISKFVPRGSVRIDNQVLGSGLECTAFLTPSKQVVVIVMNTGDDSVTFKLLDKMESGDMQAVKVTALPHSIQTFVY